MRGPHRYTCFLAVLLCILAAAVAPAQTTGTIQGVARDSDGGSLPGVTVEVRGPALQGAKAAVTDREGTYRVQLLPPGSYTVTFSISGFGTVQKTATVGLDRSVIVEATLALSTSAEITVTGEAPVVDATSSSTGSNWSSDFVRSLPTGRDFTAVATKAPGVIQGFGTDQANINVQGSTGAENNFIIDGVDTTEIQYGRQGKSAPNEFIQELEVKSGGFEAEYGHAQGGVINAVTKQGGNSFHGDVFGYYTGRADEATTGNFWQAADKNVQAKADSFGTNAAWETDPIRNTLRSDYGADLGGFALKDRIWFFGAYDRVHSGGNNFLNDPVGNCATPCDAGPGTGTLTGQTTATILNQDLYAGKLTFRITNGISLVGSVFGDPNSTSPNLTTPIAGSDPGTYQGQLQQGGVDYSVRVAGVVGNSFLFEAQAARHQEKNIQTPANTEDRLFLTVVPSGVPLQGGFGLYRVQNFHRDFFRVGATNFANLFGSHEFKVGGDYANVVSDSERFYTGPAGMKETVRVYNDTPTGTVYQHEYTSNGQRNATGDPVEVDFEGSQSNSLNYGAYFQDKWQLLPSLSVNLGVRWEGQQVKGAVGSPSEGTQISISDEWMPRVGFAWDFLGGGRSRLYGSFARFYQTMPNDINIRAYGLETAGTVFNFDPNSDVGDPAACAPEGTEDAACTLGDNPDNKFGSSLILAGGSFGEPTQPGIKGQYSDNITGGVQIQPLTDLSVGVEYVYRSLGRVIEDGGLSNPSGDLQFFIFNPGAVFEIDGVTLGEGAVVPKRYYRAVQLTAQKRFNNNLQFLASYVYATLEGNYDGVFQTSTAQLDPNINSAYDYPIFSENARGYLSNDRRSVAKIDGSYIFTTIPLTVGLSAFYYTGTPLNRMGYHNTYRNYELFLVPRGTVGRTSSVYDMDVHVAYVIKMGPADLNLGVNVFNLLNEQRTLTQDQRYNLSEDGPLNPNYLRPTSFTGRRSVQAFGRVSF